MSTEHVRVWIKREKRMSLFGVIWIGIAAIVAESEILTNLLLAPVQNGWTGGFGERIGDLAQQAALSQSHMAAWWFSVFAQPVGILVLVLSGGFRSYQYVKHGIGALLVCVVFAVLGLWLLYSLWFLDSGFSIMNPEIDTRWTRFMRGSAWGGGTFFGILSFGGGYALGYILWYLGTRVLNLFSHNGR